MFLDDSYACCDKKWLWKGKNYGKIIYDHEPLRLLMHKIQLKPLVFTQERIKMDISDSLVFRLGFQKD